MNKSSLTKMWNSFYSKIVTTVNIITYLLIIVGLVRAIYFSYYKLNWEQFTLSIIMTIFVIYINLKNPSK